MKTKIIYISGNEVFDMRDIRAALDQVRTALSLDNDTILFGVPVDNDDALAPGEAYTMVTKTDTIPEIKEIDKTPENSDSSVTEPIKKSRTRTKRQDIAPDIADDGIDIIPTPESMTIAEPVAEQEPEIAPIIKEISDTRTTDENIDTPTDENTPSDAPVVPILSILAGTSDNTPEDAEPDTIDTDPIDEIAQDTIEYTSDTDTPVVIETTEIIAAIVPDAAPTDVPAITNIDIETVTVDDLITNDAPIIPSEKTLEDLLESMSPLSEDDEITNTSTTDIDDTEIDYAEDNIVTTDDLDSTDATLEQLAAEFVEKQDELPKSTPVQKQGKLGKFKNVLPFKKIKRDDAGLMGDLFGWAGIAANDDAFAMPDFFPTTASKR